MSINVNDINNIDEPLLIKRNNKVVVETPAPKRKPFVMANRKIGRNEPCPCFSGLKYKKCHGRLL